MYGFFGLIIGFLAGMIVNSFLLKGISSEEMRKNKDLRLKYGTLNWVLALIGMLAGIALQDRL